LPRADCAPGRLRTRRRHPAIHAQRGVALVLVLWVALALTLVASAMVFSLQRELRSASDILAAAQARQAARAAVSLGMAQTLQLDPDELHQMLLEGTAGRWQSLPIGDGEVRYRITSEAGRVDLNRADPVVIVGLIREAGGVRGRRLEILTDNILDWRDPSPDTRHFGATPEEYRALGLVEGRRDGNFESVEELQQVAGITAELYQRIAPHVTVHTGLSRPVADFASTPVFAALPGVSSRFAESWVEERNRAVLEGLSPPVFRGSRAQPGTTRVFRLEAVATSGRRSRAHVEAVFGHRGGPMPVSTLEWREPPAWAPAPGAY
jgi:general secretion pathway protein K